MEVCKKKFQLLFLLSTAQSLLAQYKTILPPQSVVPKHQQEILCICSICESNTRQSNPCSIDQVVLKYPKIRISMNPRLSIHPRHHFLQECNLSCLAILQHELGNPNGLSPRPAVSQCDIILEGRSARVVVSVNREKIDLAPRAIS
jgi:hypothetical protein